MLQAIPDNPMKFPPTDRCVPAIPSYDLMLSRDNGLYSPVIFINKALPDILGCIARELQLYQGELSLMRRVSGRIQSPGEGALAGWYRSIFENIYLDVSIEDTIISRDAKRCDGFSLPVVDTLSIPFSCFLYMTLGLPPLWKTDETPRQDMPDLQYKHYLPFRNAPVRPMCHFHFAGDAGIWYAYLDKPEHKKRIFRKTCIPGRFL